MLFLTYLMIHHFAGLDCKFLQGDVTDQKKVSNFMTKLFSTGGYSDLKVLNYHKDNTLLQNTIRCFPVIDNCGPDFSSQVSHIAAILVQTKGRLRAVHALPDTLFREIITRSFTVDTHTNS